MILPLVKATSSRICSMPSHPALLTAGPMNLLQTSRSLRSFLFMQPSCSCKTQSLALLSLLAGFRIGLLASFFIDLFFKLLQRFHDFAEGRREAQDHNEPRRKDRRSVCASQHQPAAACRPTLPYASFPEPASRDHSNDANTGEAWPCPSAGEIPHEGWSLSPRTCAWREAQPRLYPLP